MLGTLLLLILQVIGVQQQEWAVPRAIEKLISENRKTAGLWSVSVRNSAGEEIVALNSDVLVTPASNMKVLTAAVVLETLGETRRLVTRAKLTGPVRNGILHGNLQIIGSGDPTMWRPFYEDPLVVFASIYDSLRAAGIREIKGSILADVSLFDEAAYPTGWQHDDLPFYYGVEINPLSFNNNTIDLLVDASGPVGSVPRIEWFPYNTDYVTVLNRQRITDAKSRYRESYQRKPGSNVIVLASKLPAGYLEKESLSIPDPHMYFCYLLKTSLEKKGLRVRGRPVDTVATIKKQIWSFGSPPVGEMMNQILAGSNNFYTEMLLKTAAAQAMGSPGTWENGGKLIRQWLANQGLDSINVRFGDGSGLWAGGLLTTQTLSGTLHAVAGKPYYQVYYSSLAASGQPGTLEKRFKGSVLESRLMAKTGYISGARALSGYLVTKSGMRVSFSIVTNHFTVRTGVIDRVHEQILSVLFEGL